MFKRVLRTTAFILGLVSLVYGGATFSRVKNWVTGERLTASDLNAEFNNVLTNFTPAGMDDYSATASQMRTTTDPYPSSSESLATSLQGELERIRYLIAQITGKTYWYQDPTVTQLFNYRRPNLIYVSATTVDIETNTATTNMTTVMFPDGDVRSVTEDVSSTSKYRRFIITETYNSTSTENSGLRTNYVEAANTWYALYAVKSTTDTSKFVIVGDTVTPVQANVSALNSQYGSNSWVYLGSIRNGNGVSSHSDILSFTQTGNITLFSNVVPAVNLQVGDLPSPGLLLANTSGATALGWTYAAGTGAAQVPGNVSHLIWQPIFGNINSSQLVKNAAGTIRYSRLYSGAATNGISYRLTIPASEGIELSFGSAASATFDALLVGFYDAALSGGPNPLF
jgi:hypothetical protein